MRREPARTGRPSQSNLLIRRRDPDAGDLVEAQSAAVMAVLVAVIHVLEECEVLRVRTVAELLVLEEPRHSDPVVQITARLLVETLAHALMAGALADED